MDSVNLNQALPPELRIASIDEILYSIGLCHHSVREHPKRSPIHNPFAIAFVVSFVMLIKTISIFTNDLLVLSLLAEFTHHIGIKLYMNIMIVIISLMTLFMQTVYYLNYKRGVKPTFIRLFQVMSGSITPSSVGLTHATEVIQLLKYGHWLKKLVILNKTLAPLLYLSYVILIYVYCGKIKSTSPIILFYHCIVSILSSYYYVTMLTVQLMVFFILCEYLLMKLREQNRMIKLQERINSHRIGNILRSIDRLIREIHEYNSTYWSKFIFNIWLLFGVLQVFLIYYLFFTTIPLFLTINGCYFSIMFSLLYLMVMSMSSSINSEANKSYKILNIYSIKYCKLSKLSIRLKVKNFIKVIK